jgi:PHD/YefM family antitoxin component YafN of YafNO toxin-antitoxin module
MIGYTIANLANMNNRITMGTKLIASTEAQNNFGRILDDVVQNGTRYVIQRRNASQAILLRMADLERLLLAPEGERQELSKVIHELSPTYSLGASVKE